MAANVLVRNTMNHTTGIPADADVNDFVFSSTVMDAATLAAWLVSAGLPHGFYNHESAGAGTAVANSISAKVDRSASGSRADYYDLTGHLDGSPLGPPILSSSYAMSGASGAETVPAEAAAVVTLYGESRATASVSLTNPTPPPAKIRPKQSYTGRLYVGPLTANAFGLVDNEVRITALFQTQLAKAARYILDQQEAAPTPVYWGVWSRKLQHVDPIVGGAVDNAPDVQRRRGVKKSNRLLWDSGTP